MVSNRQNDLIKQAAALLNQGKLVAFPTETVYGLGGDAENDRAVAQIFAVKQRPSFNPLIVHVTDLSVAEQYAVFNAQARTALAKFCPGAFTLVLPKKPSIKLSYLVTAGLETVAVRMPKHQIAQELLKEFGRGIAAPSANLSGTVSPTKASHVLASLGSKADLIIDGGNCEVGLESTVVDFTGEIPVILRHGFVTREDLEKFFPQVKVYSEAVEKPKAPGMLLSHYAPSLPLRINVLTPQKNEAYLGFGNMNCDLNLSPSGDLIEGASKLFASLRELDNAGKYKAIAVAPIPEYGLGAAINDRLKRAATGS